MLFKATAFELKSKRETWKLSFNFKMLFIYLLLFFLFNYSASFDSSPTHQHLAVIMKSSRSTEISTHPECTRETKMKTATDVSLVGANVKAPPGGDRNRNR